MAKRNHGKKKSDRNKPEPRRERQEGLEFEAIEPRILAKTITILRERGLLRPKVGSEGLTSATQ